MSRITARHPNGTAYVRICPTLEEELGSGSHLAGVIIGEVLEELAAHEDEADRRGGDCYFCADFKPTETAPRIKRSGVSYSCKYCPICGRKLI